MTGRDPAADAHTIAARIIDEMRTLSVHDIGSLLDIDRLAALTRADAIRAELRALADQLTAALDAQPAQPRYRFRHRGTDRTQGHLDALDDNPADWVLEQQRQWRGPWQPAPTTQDGADA